MPIRNYKPNNKGVGRVYNPNQRRDNLYDRAWEAYRLRFLKENPRCYSCGSKAYIVDHIRPHKGDPEAFKLMTNHLPLCKKCHDTVTGLFDKFYVVGSSIDPKLRWLADNRTKFDINFKVKVLPGYHVD